MARRLPSSARWRVRRIVRNEGFGRVEADDLLRQPRHGVIAGELGDGELPGADVDPGQSPAFPELVDRRQIAVLPSGEESQVGNRAGTDHAGDRPLDQTAAGRGHLLGDGDGVSRRQQSPQIVVERVMGDARHRRASRAAERARGQGDARVPRQDLGVLVERLVEVTEPVEEDRTGMLRLQIEILPARGDEIFAVRGFTGAVRILGTGAGHVGDYTGRENAGRE